MIRSPLNYVGNKFKLLPQILPHFPKKIFHFVDVFCGSGVVGLNSETKNLTLNDNDIKLIELLRYFKNNEIDFIFYQINDIISKFGLTDSKNKPQGFYKIYKNEGLSRHNKDAFLALRNDYNKNPNPAQLFVLILYGFNHFLRFNSSGFFNVPVGKTDFSNAQVDKTINFIKALKQDNITITSLDFTDLNLYKLGDLFYFDPPYLISDAPYNSTWDTKQEFKLYEILDFLDSNNKKFAFSNVLFSNGKENLELIKWANKYQIIKLNKQYNTSSYNRKNLSNSQEVLITNY